MPKKSTTLTRRSASRRSTCDILVGHTQRRFTPLHADPHLLSVANENAESFLIFGRHPNELDASGLPRHPSNHPKIDSHGPELIEIDEKLHVLSSLKWHGRLQETPRNRHIEYLPFPHSWPG